jgi:hypothetical protein
LRTPAIHSAASIPSKPTTATWPGTPTNPLAATHKETETSPKPTAVPLVATLTLTEPTAASPAATSTLLLCPRYMRGEPLIPP